MALFPPPKGSGFPRRINFMNSIAENIAAVRERMDTAARQAGRDPHSIMLIGASKMNGAAACQAAIAAGIDALGENRVQEMQEKLAQNAYEGAPLHFIGHLQRNKVRQVVGTAALIHSVSSLPLLEEISRQAEKRGIIQDVLLEVNVAGESTKSGFSPADIFTAAEQALAFPGVRVRGLMAIPPVPEQPQENLPYFQEVARLYIDIRQKLYHNIFNCLSMGMSGDFEDAITAGATMIRVGSAIFGHRQYAKEGT